MIVGNGMIANNIVDFDNLVFFASGVSNSQETNIAEFEREKDLFLSLPKDRPIVYFSTCSAYQSSRTPYIRHKLMMEDLVENHESLIIRLPQVVGFSDNPHTLLNYFADKINNDEEFLVWLYAVRHIVDIKDVVKHVKCLCKNEIRGVVSFTTDPLPILSIVKKMESFFVKKAKYRELPKGEFFSVPGIMIKSDLDEILNKYYKD